jgi:hypothetical protein
MAAMTTQSPSIPSHAAAAPGPSPTLAALDRLLASRAVTWIALVCILGIAATRIIDIDGPSLWTDEGFSTYTFTVDLFDAVKHDRHPPFYFYSLHGWEALTGDSVFALRFWSFLPGMLSVAFIYQIGRELARRRPGIDRAGLLGVPLLAALLMALSDGETYLAQELRMYAWQVMACAGATLCYLRWLRQPDRVHLAGWIGLLALALYTHYFSAYVVLAHGLYALIFLRGRRRLEAIGALAIVALIFAPWFFAVTRSQLFDSDVCVRDCGAHFTLSLLGEFRTSWFGQQWPLMMGLMLFGLITVIYANGRGWRVTLRPLSVSFLLAALGLIPLGITIAISHRQLPFFNHHMAQLTIPVVLLTALGLANVWRPARAALVVVIVLYSVTHVDWYRKKAPWEDVVASFAPYVEPDELVLGEIGAEESALVYYFDHLLPPGTRNSTFPFWGQLDRFSYYEVLMPQLVAQQPDTQTGDVVTVWFVYWNPDTAMLRALEANGFVRTMTTLTPHLDNDLPAYRYDILPAQPVATYANGMTLRAAQIQPDDLRVDLWWSSEAVPDADYVTSALLLDEAGQVVAQRDTVPFMGQRPAPGWTPGETVFDPKWLERAPALGDLPAGAYTVAVQVYRFTPDGSIQPAPLADGAPYAIVGTLNID